MAVPRASSHLVAKFAAAQTSIRAAPSVSVGDDDDDSATDHEDAGSVPFVLATIPENAASDLTAIIATICQPLKHLVVQFGADKVFEVVSQALYQHYHHSTWHVTVPKGYNKDTGDDLDQERSLSPILRPGNDPFGDFIAQCRAGTRDSVQIHEDEEVTDTDENDDEMEAEPAETTGGLGSGDDEDVGGDADYVDDGREDDVEDSGDDEVTDEETDAEA